MVNLMGAGFCNELAAHRRTDSTLSRMHFLKISSFNLHRVDRAHASDCYSFLISLEIHLRKQWPHKLVRQPGPVAACSAQRRCPHLARAKHKSNGRQRRMRPETLARPMCSREATFLPVDVINAAVPSYRKFSGNIRHWRRLQGGHNLIHDRLPARIQCQIRWFDRCVRGVVVGWRTVSGEGCNNHKAPFTVISDIAQCGH